MWLAVRSSMTGTVRSSRVSLTVSVTVTVSGSAFASMPVCAALGDCPEHLLGIALDKGMNDRPKTTYLGQKF